MLPVAYGHQHVRVPRGRYPFAVHPAIATAARCCGVASSSSAVLLGDGMLDVRFGRWRLTTPLSNITAVSLAGHRQRWSALGVRLHADRGLSFTADPTIIGVTVRFGRPVRAFDPWGIVTHPWLAVVVTTPDELDESLRALVAPERAAGQPLTDDVRGRPRSSTG